MKDEAQSDAAADAAPNAAPEADPTIPGEVTGHGAVLLLSGGMDSAALAAWVRPSATLFIDYGQRPAQAERRASRAIATALDLPFFEFEVDLSPVGSGLLHSESMNNASEPGSGGEGGTQSGYDTDVLTPSRLPSPSPEWWPLRNQLLGTLAAAWTLSGSAPKSPPLRLVLLASVLSDGRRHVDGTASFYEALNAVTVMQEGAVRVAAPAIGMETDELVRRSGITEAVLGWSHSCHRSDSPCAACPGCWKREQVLARLGMLGYPLESRVSSPHDGPGEAPNS